MCLSGCGYPKKLGCRISWALCLTFMRPPRRRIGVLAQQVLNSHRDVPRQEGVTIASCFSGTEVIGSPVALLDASIYFARHSRRAGAPNTSVPSRSEYGAKHLTSWSRF